MFRRYWKSAVVQPPSCIPFLVRKDGPIDTVHDLGITVRTQSLWSHHMNHYTLLTWVLSDVTPISCRSVLPLTYHMRWHKFGSRILVSVEGFKTRSVTRYNTYHTVSQGITKHHKVSQSITRHHKVSQGITRYHKVSQGITEYHKVSQNITKVSQGITKYHKLSQSITRHHKVSQSITRYHKVSQGIKKYHKVPQSITRYHKVSQSMKYFSRLIGVHEFCFT